MMMDKEHIEKIKQARLKYKPEKIKCLFIAEAPPAATDRFFYFEDVTEQDSLYLELMKVLFSDAKKEMHSLSDLIMPLGTDDLRKKKKEYLDRFKAKGYYLIDNLDYPMPQDVSGTNNKIRYLDRCTKSLLQKVEATIDKQTPIVLISVPVYRANAASLKYHGYNVIHDFPIEFPGSGQQKNFREKMEKLFEEDI